MVLLELVLILAVSGTSAAVPGLLPDYPRRAVLLALCLALVHQIMPGGVASMGSRRRSVHGMGENTKKMYDKSEIASKPGRFELEKSKKNRRNLRLIQTCDFLFCAFCIKFYETYLGVV